MKEPCDFWGNLGWGFGGVGEIGYICKLNPNRSLGRMRIF